MRRLDDDLEPIAEIAPPHCPYPTCADHRRGSAGYRTTRHGCYRGFRGTSIHKYRCATCGRTFSANAFSSTYFLKRPDLTLPIVAGLVAGSSHRQIARSLGCAHSTVSRRAARLGRHGILLLGRSLEILRGRRLEPVVVDHFETFELCQQDAVGIATAVGKHSGFLYGLDPVPHRRGGRKKARARRDRHRPVRDGRGGYAGSYGRVLDVLTRLLPDHATLELTEDGHPAYRRGLSRHPQRERVRVRSFPNPRPRRREDGTKNAAARIRDREMFPVDALHGLMRHTLAHHRRETIAFGRRLNALMERAFLFAVWRNLVKRCTERRPCRETPAMRVGLTRRPLSWRDVLVRRLFPGRVELPPVWRELYRRDWITPALPSNTTHRLVLAY